VVYFIDLFVATTKGCRKVSVLRETINDIGVAACVEDVHSRGKLLTKLAIRSMVGCGEHVIVDGLVVEVMQVGVHLRVARLAREALFLPSCVPNKIGLTLAHLDTLRVKASQSCI